MKLDLNKKFLQKIHIFLFSKTDIPKKNKKLIFVIAVKQVNH
jgi:hypothetical protein